MILPTKHITIERSLLGVGAEILTIIKKRPETISELWNKIRKNHEESSQKKPISYRWFVLSLDLLYLIGAVRFEEGLMTVDLKC